ncbi:hypothetical protein D917_05936, partial [Trichinella nativa]
LLELVNLFLYFFADIISSNQIDRRSISFKSALLGMSSSEIAPKASNGTTSKKYGGIVPLLEVEDMLLMGDHPDYNFVTLQIFPQDVSRIIQ